MYLQLFCAFYTFNSSKSDQKKKDQLKRNWVMEDQPVKNKRSIT